MSYQLWTADMVTLFWEKQAKKQLQPLYNYTTHYLPILQKCLFYKFFIISYLQKIKYSTPFYISFEL